MSGKGINWPGLLKWSLNYSDGTQETTPMSIERLRFLEAAIKEAMGAYEDPTDVVKEAAKKLKSEEAQEGDMINALQLIERCIDEAPEISRNIDKLGVLEVLIGIMNHPNTKVSDAALRILQFAFPNNPSVQQSAWKLNCLPLLIADEQECAKSHLRFGALSGLIRHEPNIEKDFIGQHGCQILVAGLRSSNPKVQSKSANLLRHLFEEGSLPPELAIKSNIGSALAHMIDSPPGEDGGRGIQYGETACSAIHASLTACAPLAKTNPKLVEEQQSQLVAALCNRLNYLGPTDDNQRERAMIEAAIQLIQQGGKAGDNHDGHVG